MRADLLALRARLAAIRDAAEVAIAEVDLAIASAAMRTTPAGRTAAAGGTAGSPAPREEWLSIAEAAKEFNLTKKWLYAHLMEFPGARKRGPKLIRIPRSDLERHGLRCRETD